MAFNIESLKKNKYVYVAAVVVAGVVAVFAGLDPGELVDQVTSFFSSAVVE